MSDWGTFVTEVIQCPECYGRVKEALERAPRVRFVAVGNAFAGVVHDIGPECEYRDLEAAFEGEGRRPCHVVTLAVVCETGAVQRFEISPDYGLDHDGYIPSHAEIAEQERREAQRQQDIMRAQRERFAQDIADGVPEKLAEMMRKRTT